MSSARFNNPYAKRKEPSNISSSSERPHRNVPQPANTSNNTPASTTRPLPPRTSFSQAFESIEETDHYQRASARGVATGEDAVERAEQRALDATTTNTTETSNNIAAATDQDLSDRDFHVQLGQPHVLYVSTKQRGNGVLQYIRNVPYTFSRMVPDYILHTTRCALFLSCKYHSLYPNYIYRRLAELKTDFTLRLLLVLVDTADNANILLFLNTLCVTHNVTLLLAWSDEEAARYLETYAALDGYNASAIQKKQATTYVDQAADVLHTVKLNTTDAGQLLAHFSSIRNVCAASMDELALVAGLGPVKVRRLYQALHQPFGKLRQREATATAVEGGDDGAVAADKELSALADKDPVSADVIFNAHDNEDDRLSADSNGE